MEKISPKALIGKGNRFGSYVVIGDDVAIGDNNVFGDFVSIHGKVSIGSENIFASHASIGGTSNHVIRKKMKTKFTGDHELEKIAQSGISIGSNNCFGEFVAIHLPVLSNTYVGNRCNIGYHTLVSHDVVIDDDVITGLQSAIGGYVHLQTGVYLGINSMVHPRLVIGQFAAAGLGTVILRHILPGSTVVGNPARYLKINAVGLMRNNFSKEEIEEFRLYLESNIIHVDQIKNIKVRDIFREFYEKILPWRAVNTIPDKKE